MKTVTIQYCYGEHKTIVSHHRTDDDDAAIESAIRKHYGKRAQFFRDNGICTTSTQYGQIGHYVDRIGAASMDTGRVSIQVATKPHGLSDRPSNARKGPEPRTALFSVRLTQSTAGRLESLKEPGESKSDCIARLIDESMISPE